jgi:hypothetical protein
MTGTTLNNLPPAIALSGAELVWLYQPGPNPLVTPWIGVSCTTSQIANLLTTSGGGSSTCSMRQLFAAMANQSVLVLAFGSLPGDQTNQYNIAWYHAYRMTITDPFITGFLEPAIGYTGAQMAALFVLAQSFPV